MKQPHAPANQVTTEPQRRALEDMSADLVRKLNQMVAEQEARARDFAAHQHSLSALPTQVPPQVKPFEPQQKKRKYAQNVPQPPVVSQPAYTPEPTYTPDYTDYLPPVPKSTPARHKTPTVIKGKKKDEEGIGSTAVIIILIVLFLLISKSCS